MKAQLKLSPLQQSLKLQKKILRELKLEVDQLLGKMPEAIQRYERGYQVDFKTNQTSLQTLSKDQLISKIRSVDVTFIGDFHTFDQAQRTALRIMRESIEPHQKWFIGLELVPTHFQEALNQYQLGKLSTEDFHQIISYPEEWGFPWKNYSPIFEWAKSTQIPLIALNTPKPLLKTKKTQELPVRDKWAAGVITDLFHFEHQQGRHPKMIVIYGELHVGSQHIPKQLKKFSKLYLNSPLSSLIIHQNHDRLFWKLAEANPRAMQNIILLQENIVCLISSTPWAKLQSLINWIEGNPLDTLESETDYLSMLCQYGNSLSEFLNIPVSNYETLNLFTVQQIEQFNAHLREKQFKRDERKLVEFHINHNFRIYLAKISAIYLGIPSLNSATELAAIHLFKSHNTPNSKRIFSLNEEDFSRLVLEFAFGFFGSLLINPQRKCDLFQDHLKRIQELNAGLKPRFPFEKESRSVAIKKLTIQSLISLGKDLIGPYMAARYLGQILGKKLHKALFEENFQLTHIKGLFFPGLQEIAKNQFFQERLKELEDLVSEVKVAQSKLDSF